MNDAMLLAITILLSFLWALAWAARCEDEVTSYSTHFLLRVWLVVLGGPIVWFGAAIVLIFLLCDAVIGIFSGCKWR